MSVPTLLVNGVANAPLSARDRGLSFGDGLFETTAAINGRVRFINRHLDRLEQGCRQLQIPPPDRGTLEQEMRQLATGDQRAVIKLIVTRGAGGFGYAPPAVCQPTRIVERLPWPARDEEDYRLGIAVGICRTRVSRQPVLAGIKHLNRLEQVLARGEIASQGLSEGIMLDECDNVIEATAANVFAVCKGVLVTPRLHISGVRGVMREVVLEAAGKCGIAVRCGRLELLQLLHADEIFLTNSLAGVLPVRSLANACFQPGPVAAALAATLRDEHIHPVGAE